MAGLMDLLGRAWPALPFGVMQKAPQMAQQAWSGITAPRDAYQGNMDPMSPEGLSRINSLAGLMAGVPGGRGGFGSGARLPAKLGGAAEPEFLSPNQPSMEPPSPQAQLRQLENQQRTLMQLGPMVPALIKLGVTQEQMMAMNPVQAYQFVKERSPQGMGTVDHQATQSVMDAIDQIRQQRSTITDALLADKK